MKHLKYFDNNNEEPQVGDYVIWEDSTRKVEDFQNFICNTIGQIVKIYNDGDYDDDFPYVIKYENIPYEILAAFSYDDYPEKCTRIMCKEEIIHFSKNKEDLEIILKAKEYNIIYETS